jgi:tungstate transport system ATP-binding protein
VAETLLTLRDIAVLYGERVALRLPSLEIKAGNLLAVIGPNGAGKSTLLRVMGLLQRPTEGRVLLCGKDALPANVLELRRRIATVFQEPLLLNATVYQNAALGLKLRGVSAAEINRRLAPWLEKLGIAHLASRSARTLSGGEAQRTSLARALVLKPDLLLLDEPWAPLDPASREEFLRDFGRIVKETRLTTVFVTHDREEAFALAEQVAVLDSGRLLELGHREEVFFHPSCDASAEIVGIANRLPGTVHGRDGAAVLVRVCDQILNVTSKLKAEKNVVVCIRPEQLSVQRGNACASAHNQLKGRIVEISPSIGAYQTIVDCGDFRLIASIERQRFIEGGYSEGDEIIVTVSPTSIHLIPA